MQISGKRVEIKQASDDLTTCLVGVHVAHRSISVGGIIVGVQFVQAYRRAVMLQHIDHLTRRIVRGDLAARGDEINAADGVIDRFRNPDLQAACSKRPAGGRLPGHFGERELSGRESGNHGEHDRHPA